MGHIGGKKAFIVERGGQTRNQLIDRRDDGLNLKRGAVNGDRRQIIRRPRFQLFLQFGEWAGNTPYRLVANQQRQANHKYAGDDQAGDRLANFVHDMAIVVAIIPQRLLEQLDLLSAFMP
ncbi:Uncharacterised protein [Salmonella enterica subsp. enterica serovar Typhi]|nr:Uncharacterised protein [Salmonella enterica subsp. enterica serovar Typhi]CQY08222.1 Uncharacterised protein [Salmonella enterica subsp. enterica serovar Typhi]